VRLGVEERAVPDAEQAQQHGRVGLQRRGAEVLVHDPESVEHLPELLGADGDQQREPDRGVVGVSPADPVPELEHVGRVDAELGHLLGVGGHSDEVAGDRRPVAPEAGQQPAPRRRGVGDRLDRGERLGRHDEQRLGRVEVAHRLVQVGAVDVRHEAEGQPAVGVRPQRLGRHGRAEVGAADADVDDRPDPTPGLPGPLPRPHPPREVRHAVQHRVHAGHHVLAVDLDHGVARRPQCGVQHRTPLGDVDLLAAEHRVPQRLHPGRHGQLAQQAQRLVGHELLGVVEEEVADAEAVPLDPLRVALEQLPQVHLPHLLTVLGERTPLSRPVQPDPRACVHPQLSPSVSV
jgi:hypothetical protein